MRPRSTHSVPLPWRRPFCQAPPYLSPLRYVTMPWPVRQRGHEVRHAPQQQQQQQEGGVGCWRLALLLLAPGVLQVCAAPGASPWRWLSLHSPLYCSPDTRNTVAWPPSFWACRQAAVGHVAGVTRTARSAEQRVGSATRAHAPFCCGPATASLRRVLVPLMLSLGPASWRWERGWRR